MTKNRKNKIICILTALFFAAGFLLCVFLPKPEYLAAERRRAALRPELSLDAVMSGRFMDGFESWSTDTFPMRDQLRTVQALTATRVFLQKDNNGIYDHKGILAAVEYPMDPDSVRHAADRFRYLYDTYLTPETKVYLAVIPDKGCFLAKESGHPAMDYEAFERLMADQTEFATLIPIRDLLSIDDYYRTDTHWRQEKITDVADRLTEYMGGVLTADRADYEVHTPNQAFYGVYYGQAALPVEPENLCYLTDDVIDGYLVYDWQNGKEIPVYDLERAAGRDPYEMFLSGSLSLVTIENKAAEGGRSLVIFRDSFGSSIAPLLARSYERVTLIDIRYIQPDLLGQFVDFSDSDVLFLYSTLVLGHSETLK